MSPTKLSVSCDGEKANQYDKGMVTMAYTTGAPILISVWQRAVVYFPFQKHITLSILVYFQPEHVT